MHGYDENNQRKRSHYFEKEKWVGQRKNWRDRKQGVLVGERKQGVLEGRKKGGVNFVL